MSKVTEVLESREGVFDLSNPPDRAEAGLPDGAATVAYQRNDHEPIRVQVKLPEERELVVDAKLLAFDALTQADPTTAQPITMDIHHYAESLEAGRDRLLAAAVEFGFDPAPIQQWFDAADGRTPWLGADVDYLRLELQGSHKPPVDDADTAQTVIHYVLTWQAQASESP